MKRLNPNNCSVLVFYNHEQDFASTLDLLSKVFSDVIVKSTESQVISQLKQHSTTSTLLLIDAESCHTKTMEECPPLLLTIVDLLKQGLITNVVPIVCSTLDSPSYMVKCLQSGAADFVLKPLSEDVAKTLFLNVTRNRLLHAESTLEKVEQTSSIWDSQQGKKGQVWSKFRNRLKGVFLEENWYVVFVYNSASFNEYHRLSKLVAEYYTPKPSVRRSSMASMLSWDFSPLDLDNKDLIQVVFMILNHTLMSFDELEALRVPNGDLYHFIFDICNSYHSSNPYHNFRHAVDVLQANYYFLCKIGAIEPMCPMIRSEDPMIKQLLQPIDIFALLMASIGHDVGHPGVNNNFMITTSTPLAILYNDKSVLESFHAMSFFHLLKEHCFGQLTDLRANPEYSIFRKIVVNSILATDMSMHDEYVHKITDQAERIKNIDLTDKSACEKEKVLLCGALIKCADISNCARPFESAKEWAKILAQEFFEQGDLERELGMPVLPINERGKICLEDFQISFKKFVALKLFESICKVTTNMQFTIDYIHENINIWESMKSKREPVDKLVTTPNTIPPQPTPDGSCTPSQRPRSGI
ncbi:hypothetical protein MFLAVUS_007821 [Mucor flavus]|uniref:Phosphodiesterase n=1 Tax=Mucor flavus TaxID=439312 RepID=A0ABP9Z5E7_9FUNG